MTAPKPAQRPRVAHFSSGPCAKRPGYSPENLKNAYLGRSHRAKPGKAKLKLAIDETRVVLGVPDDYLIGIVAASDTGAFERPFFDQPITVISIVFALNIERLAVTPIHQCQTPLALELRGDHETASG